MLERKALEIRRKVLEIVSKGKWQIGGSLSCVDILVALYYKLLTDEKFILSKGHACLPLYVILADKGYIKELNFCENGGLPGHPERKINGILADTGSLGHGLGIGAGMALSGRKVVVLIGDGELYEGSTWEAILFIAHHKLDVTLIIDRNRQIVQDFTEDINKLYPLQNKMEAFNWNVKSIDGHKFDDIIDAFKGERPLCIIAHTIKGKGISFMEQCLKWHHTIPNKEEYEKARCELGR